MRDTIRQDPISEFIQSLKWPNVPAKAKKRIKWALIDTVGSMVTGTRANISEIVTEYAMEFYPGEDSTVVGEGKTNLLGAALANGYIANGFDIDDGGKYTRGHPGAQVVPTALAICESYDRSAEEFLTELAIGYEIAFRAGRCFHDYYRGYRACGSWGSVACAAVASRSLELSSRQIQNALGIAEYNSPHLPMMRAIDDPAMTKHGTGWGPLVGISSAKLAKLGFTGVPSIFHKFGEENSVRDLGDHYIISENAGLKFKEFASCGWGHSAIAAASELVTKNDFSPQEIKKIWVKGFHNMAQLDSRKPKTEEEAQFSVAWPLAAFILEKEVGPDQMEASRLVDEEILSIAEKIEVSETKELTELARDVEAGDDESQQWLSSVEILLKDGTFLQSEKKPRQKGAIEDWTEVELSEKFLWLVSPVLGKRSAALLLKSLKNVEKLDSVTQLTSFLT